MAVSDDSNQSPILNVGPSYPALVGHDFGYIVDFDDPDLDDIFTFSAANIPSWLRFEQQIGLLYGNPKAEDIGSYVVDITVSDNHGGSESKTLTIEVNSQPSNDSFSENNFDAIWDPFAVIDETRRTIDLDGLPLSPGKITPNLAIIGVSSSLTGGFLHGGNLPYRYQHSFEPSTNRTFLEFTNTDTGETSSLIATGFVTSPELFDLNASYEVLDGTKPHISWFDSKLNLLYSDHTPVHIFGGELTNDGYVLDASKAPDPGNASGWQYTFVSIRDLDPINPEKKTYIGSEARDDFYASAGETIFVSGNSEQSDYQDHITYIESAESGIEIDFASGTTLKDGAGFSDSFEPHKFGVDATSFDDEFYGVYNERIDGNDGDDFYHSFVDDAQGFNLRVGLGADLVVPTTDLSGSKWKTGDVRLSPDAFWNAGYYAENIDTLGGGIGTGELISLSGMGRYTDIIICAMEFDANDQALMIMDDVTFHLGEYVDTPSHDAFFLDDAFSARHAETEASFSNRIGQHERFTSMQTLYAGDGDDLIDLSSARYENQASAAIFGEEGNDILWGGDSPEMLDGGAGDDVLFGGMGSDILIGGAGSDEFQFTVTSTTAPQDFNPAEDSITVFRRIGIDDDFVVEVDSGRITLGSLNFGTFDVGLTLDDVSVSYEEIHGGLVVTFTSL